MWWKKSVDWSAAPGLSQSETPRGEQSPEEGGHPSSLPLTARMVVDRVGNVLAFDPEMERLTGWPADEIVGRHKSLGDYSGADEMGLRRYLEHPLFEGSIEQVTHSNSQRLTFNTKSGGTLVADVIVTPLGPHGDRFSLEVWQIVAKHEPLGAKPLPEDVADTEGFLRKLERSFRDARSTGQPAAVLMVELDQLATLRETWGAGELDALVRRTTDILRAIVRPGDHVARVRGDRFGVLLDAADRDVSRHVGGRVRSTIERFVFGKTNDGPLHLTVSIGIACYPSDGVQPENLMSQASNALFEAQRLGRNRVWCYVRRPRVGLQAPVYFDGPGAQLLGVTRNVSHTGLYIETDDDLPVGMRLGLSFRLPSQPEPVRCIGRVVRREDSEEDSFEPPGLGVAIEKLSQRDRQLIETFLHENPIRR